MTRRTNIHGMEVVAVSVLLAAAGVFAAPPGGFPYELAPLGDEIEVAAAAANVFTVSPDAALLPNLAWAAAWSDNDPSNPHGRYEALIRLYAASGTPISGALFANRDFADNGEVVEGPRIAGVGADRYAVAWIDSGDLERDQLNLNVAFSLFGSNGQRIGSGDTFVNLVLYGGAATPPVDTYDVDIAAGDRSTFCIVWSENRPPADDTFTILGRRFRADGSAIDRFEFRLNELFAGVIAQRTGVAAGSNGDFFVVWADDRVELTDLRRYRYDIYGRVVPGGYRRPGDANAPVPEPAPSTVEHAVSYRYLHGRPAPGADNASWPAVASGDGKYLVVWQNDNLDDGTTDIHASLRDAAGAALGEEFRVDGGYPDTEQTQPSAAHLGEGRFLIVWVDYDPQVGDHVVGRVYDSRAHRMLTDEFFFSVDDVGVGAEVSAAALAGRWLAGWSSNGPQLGIFALRGELRARPRLGDLNGDGNVDFRDLFILARAWQRTGAHSADLNRTGRVDDADLLLLRRAMNEPSPAVARVVPALAKGGVSATLRPWRIAP